MDDHNLEDKVDDANHHQHDDASHEHHHSHSMCEKILKYGGGPRSNALSFIGGLTAGALYSFNRDSGASAAVILIAPPLIATLTSYGTTRFISNYANTAQRNAAIYRETRKLVENDSHPNLSVQDIYDLTVAEIQKPGSPRRMALLKGRNSAYWAAAGGAIGGVVGLCAKALLER